MAFLITLVAAALLGFALERLFLRPMIGEPAISIIMLTIGLASFLKGVLNVIWGSETMVYPAIFSAEPLRLGPVVVSQVYLYSVFFRGPLPGPVQSLFPALPLGDRHAGRGQ